MVPYQLKARSKHFFHVCECIKKKVVEPLERYGSRVLEARYSEVNDSTYVNAELGEYVKLRSYRDLPKLAARRPTKLNIVRALVYSLVKAIPSLRMLIVVVAEKTIYIESLRGVARW
ncbi:MAG: hypothetical protein QXJ97_09230 [Desulfurococcaceae archaeon]